MVKFPADRKELTNDDIARFLRQEHCAAIERHSRGVVNMCDPALTEYELDLYLSVYRRALWIFDWNKGIPKRRLIGAVNE